MSTSILERTAVPPSRRKACGSHGCIARYRHEGDRLEMRYAEGVSPGASPGDSVLLDLCIAVRDDGAHFVARDALPRALNALVNRCYETERRGGVGQWIALTDGEMVVLGLRRLNETDSNVSHWR
jgi:hypothetical protein